MLRYVDMYKANPSRVFLLVDLLEAFRVRRHLPPLKRDSASRKRAYSWAYDPTTKPSWHPTSPLDPASPPLLDAPPPAVLMLCLAGDVSNAPTRPTGERPARAPLRTPDWGRIFDEGRSALIAKGALEASRSLAA
eukprot:4585260-Pyramimonas_sp.AAC.1